MTSCAVILLAHLNPLTNAHKEIILSLTKDHNVYVMPVIFLKKGREITTRSFPFPYHVRKTMIESVFDDKNLIVLPNYCFESPFIKYFPPLISPFSWILRKRILENIREEHFISYTGDAVERLMLKAYLMHPTKSTRLDISASSVRESLYREVATNNSGKYKNRYHWEDMVPSDVANIIKDNWAIIERFATCADHTIRIKGVKFPRDGLFLR